RVSDSDSLVLYGEKLQLGPILLDGNEVAPDLIEVDDHQLTIAQVPDSFLLEITTTINPQDNTSLSGLYLSSGIFCTQCEAEGFRRITYYPDRPDVLARFTTRIEADRNRFPVLLSNGNLESSGQMDDGFHFAEWHDPFPKPCYLFALVAGDLAAHSDTFTTRSGRAVDLYIYTEHRNQGTCAHAMESLKKAMRWDEETFGLEYDLDRYMIVAVDDFNMGAMENKGLNIFNSKYVLASQETATDQDYLHIEGVIAHEYFHNWTGNRVTCRDWFQLSLKEGLTVFRDQQFSADMNSRAVQRIKDVRLLRHYQFREDEGPMAHPVRPDTYMEINNFYTVTVYNKGAEVVRMIHTLLGPEEFRKGMDLYFARHDGQAVTCDDFVAAMADASGRDLCRFKRWYSQAGTPVIECIERWDEKTGTLRLTVRQHTPATPGQPYKQPFHLPILCGFIDARGNDVSQSITCGYRSQGQDILLELTEHEQDFVFSGFAERPVVSLFRFFSAPVKISPFQTKGQTAVLMSHDSDPFNRWNASFSYCSSAIVELVESSSEVRNTVLDGDFTNAMGSFISDKGGDDALNALALQLPEESFLALSLRDVDPDRLHGARTHIKHQLGISLFDTFLSAYQSRNDDRNYDISSEAIGRRSLKNTCLDYLVCVHDVHPETVELARDQYFRADNMTDQMAVLASVSHISGDVREELFGNFETRWLDNPLVMDKWFSLQALSAADDTLERVKKLLTHKAFSIKNPNKVRSLIGAFSQNHVRFHQDNGSGYHFLADKILEVDRLNPQIAARLAGPLISWQRYEPLRKSLMKKTLATIKSTGRLSRDVYEIVSKGLEG
ncbi:MAG: aminopeptidase N, partial [Desulfofustis sp.]|nr:aminopeptidase N [Desulfofustis sp.]